MISDFRSDIIEYLAFTDARTEIFGHKGEVCPKLYIMLT